MTPASQLSSRPEPARNGRQDTPAPSLSERKITRFGRNSARFVLGARSRNRCAWPTPLAHSAGAESRSSRVDQSAADQKSEAPSLSEFRRDGWLHEHDDGDDRQCSSNDAPRDRLESGRVKCGERREPHEEGTPDRWYARRLRFLRLAHVLKPPHAPPDLDVGAKHIERERDDHVHAGSLAQRLAQRLTASVRPSLVRAFENASGRHLARRRALVAPARRAELPVATLGTLVVASADAVMVGATPAPLGVVRRCRSVPGREQSGEREHETGHQQSNHGDLLGAERPILPGHQGSGRRSTAGGPV